MPGGYWLSSRALRPVDEITSVARSIGVQNLSQRVAVPHTGDEIERIPSGHDGVAPERRAEFEQAMARLNPRERAMLWLAYAEGASHRDIAAILGLRTASLKAMLFRARRKVAALLGHQPAGARR